MPLGTFTFKFQECNWKNLFHICELFKHLQKLFGLFVMTMIKFYPCQCKSKCSRHSGCCAGSSNWVFARFFEKHLNIRNICATLRFPALATRPARCIPLEKVWPLYVQFSQQMCVSWFVRRSHSKNSLLLTNGFILDGIFLAIQPIISGNLTLLCISKYLCSSSRRHFREREKSEKCLSTSCFDNIPFKIRSPT